MYRHTRRLIHRLVLRPIARSVLRLDVIGAHLLDRDGPAIVVSNHNSHVDTAVLMAAYPTARIDRVHPVAAADYFLRNRLLSWFTTRIVGILPLDRKHSSDVDPLFEASQALDAGGTLVLFPEGTRGEPGVLGEFKSGVARLARRHSDVPVIPVWLNGCERAMPKGSRLPRSVPCSAAIGRPLFIRPNESTAEFLVRLRSTMVALDRERGEAA